MEKKKANCLSVKPGKVFERNKSLHGVKIQALNWGKNPSMGNGKVLNCSPKPIVLPIGTKNPGTKLKKKHSIYISGKYSSRGEMTI